MATKTSDAADSENLPQGPLTQRFDLATFTDELLADLRDLRAGRISAQQAHARAALARQVLRAVFFIVTAQKHLSDNAREISVQSEGV